MFCVKCGYKLDGEFDFCPKCGAKTTSESARASENQTIIYSNSKSRFSFLSNKRIKLILLCIVLVLFIAIVAVISVNVINSGKQQAYNEGVAYLQSSNLSDAKESFEKAKGYKDADLYWSATKASIELYNNQDISQAKETLIDMVEDQELQNSIKNFPERESSKLACFVIGDTYFSDGDYQNASSFFQLIPTTYNFNRHSVYEKLAICNLVGTWNCTEKLESNYDNTTLTASRNSVFVFSADGKCVQEPLEEVVTNKGTTGGYTIFHGSSAEVLEWHVDLDYDGADGVFRYYFGSDKTSKFQVSNNVFNYVVKIGNESTGTYTGTRI